MENIVKINLKFLFKLLPFFLITLFSYLSLHETLNMFFLGDDFGFVYRLKTHGTYPWPSHELVNMYHPLYVIFQTEPRGYFAVGFLFFVISAVLFYFLAKSIFSNNRYALIAALVYATAPVGIESVEMMLVYIGSYYALSLLSLILIFFLKFLKTGKILYFPLSIIIFAIAAETVTFRAFLFPAVMFLFGLFFWNRRKLEVKKLIISYIIITFVWMLFYFFRPYLLQWNENFTSLKTNLDFTYVITAWQVFFPRFIHQFPGNGFLDGFFQYLFNSIYIYPIRALHPLIGTLNIIFTIPSVGIIPLLHIPTAFMLILFSVFIIKKKKSLGKFSINIYFASIVFIFAAVFAFFLPFPRNLMPVKDHYAAYALPGYALFITSTYIVLITLFNKKKITILKIIPHLLLAIIISINIVNNRNYLAEFNRRILYVRPFFEQIKQLQPVLPPNPVIYIQPLVNPADDPAEARWRLYDIWHGGIMGPNAVFGLFYDNINANQTVVASTWETLLDAVKKDPKAIDRLYGFDYDLDGLHPTTDKVRKKLQSEILQKN